MGIVRVAYHIVTIKVGVLEKTVIGATIKNKIFLSLDFSLLSVHTINVRNSMHSRKGESYGAYKNNS